MIRSYISVVVCSFLILGCGSDFSITSPSTSKALPAPAGPREPAFPEPTETHFESAVDVIADGTFVLRSSRLSILNTGFGERRLRFAYATDTNQFDEIRCEDAHESFREWFINGGSLQSLSLDLQIPFQISVSQTQLKPTQSWRVSIQLQGRESLRTCSPQLNAFAPSRDRLSLGDVFDLAQADQTNGVWTSRNSKSKIRGTIVKSEVGFDLFVELIESTGSVVAQLQFARAAQQDAQPQKSQQSVKQEPVIDTEPLGPTQPARQSQRPVTTALPDRRIVVRPPPPEAPTGEMPPPFIEVPPEEQEAFLKDADVQCENPADCPDAVGMIVGRRNKKELYLCSAIRIAPNIVATNSHCLPKPRRSGELYFRDFECKDSLWILYPKTGSRPAEREACAEILHSNSLDENKLDNKDWAYLRVSDPVDRGYARVGTEPFTRTRRLTMWAMDPVLNTSGLHGRIVRKTCVASEVPFYRRNKAYEEGTYPNLLFSDCSPGIVRGNSGSGLLEGDGQQGLTLRALVSAGLFPLDAQAAEQGFGPNARCLPVPASSLYPIETRNACRIIQKATRDAEESPENVGYQVEGALWTDLKGAIEDFFKSSRGYSSTRELSYEKFFTDFKGSPFFDLMYGYGHNEKFEFDKGSNAFYLRDGTRVVVANAVLKGRSTIHFNPACLVYPQSFHEKVLFGKTPWPDRFREDFEYLPGFLSPIRYQSPVVVSAPIKWFTVDVGLRSTDHNSIDHLEFDRAVTQHDGRAELTLSDYVYEVSGRWYMKAYPQAKWRLVDPATNEVVFEKTITEYCK